jgi:Flp pilus assembly protein TadD
MSESAGPGGKRPDRVPVHYFPKRPRARPDPTQTSTLTEVPRVRTDLEAVPTEAVEIPEPPRERPRKAGKAKKEHKAPRRTFTPLSVDTDPALQYHKDKLTELIQRADPVESLRHLSNAQIAEMAAFGHQLFEQGRLQEARIVFEGLVGFGVEDAFPHTMLGTVYLALGRFDRALALFEAALGFDETDIAALVYRGEIRLNQGKVKTALADLEQVVEIGRAGDPFVERARRLIGMAQAARRR